MSQQNPPTGDTNTTLPQPPDGEYSKTHPGDSTPPPELGSNRFFAWLRGLGISRQPGWIGGVCAGIAARLGIDPLIVRGIVVVLAILGAPALLLYAAAWLLLPDYKDRIHLEEAFRGKFDAPVIGSAPYSFWRSSRLARDSGSSAQITGVARTGSMRRAASFGPSLWWVW